MSDQGVYKSAPTPAATVPISMLNETHAVNGIRRGAWGAEICGCFTDIVPNCCMATCLPFISIAQIAHRISVARYAYVLLTFLALYIAEVVFSTIAWIAIWNNYQDNRDSIWRSDSYYGRYYYGDVSDTAIVSASFSNVVCGIVALIYFLLVWQLRSKVRERFQIPGSCCGDYCCVFWCSCCTIAQMATHTKSYKPGSCDFGPPDVLPAFD